jgi:hypothetical protein
VQENQVHILPAELAAGGEGRIRGVDEPEVGQLDPGAGQFPGDAGEVALEARLETGELGPVGVEADAEQAEAGAGEASWGGIT